RRTPVSAPVSSYGSSGTERSESMAHPVSSPPAILGILADPTLTPFLLSPDRSWNRIPKALHFHKEMG
ncbi:MAG: hypothetical protein D6795_04270, partial [Deltaproteobacteria bacterium]